VTTKGSTRVQDHINNERRFLAHIAELGAKLAPGSAYVNVNTPVPLICRGWSRLQASADPITAR